MTQEVLLFGRVVVQFNYMEYSREWRAGRSVAARLGAEVTASQQHQRRQRANYNSICNVVNVCLSNFDVTPEMTNGNPYRGDARVNAAAEGGPPGAPLALAAPAGAAAGSEGAVSRVEPGAGAVAPTAESQPHGPATASDGEPLGKLIASGLAQRGQCVRDGERPGAAPAPRSATSADGCAPLGWRTDGSAVAAAGRWGGRSPAAPSCMTKHSQLATSNAAIEGQRLAGGGRVGSRCCLAVVFFNCAGCGQLALFVVLLVRWVSTAPAAHGDKFPSASSPSARGSNNH